jgi:ferredoxin
MDTETKPSAAARRQFLADTARMACGVGLLGLGVGLYARHARALPPAAIRPPGALPEADFSAACIRCGLCVRDCPFNILHLAKPEEPMSTGTPYFVARQLPCEMCEDIPCVKACPTGALDHSLKDINKSKDGLGGAGGSRDLPEFPRSALRHLLSRLPGDRQGDHARPADQCAHRQAHPVHSRGAFGALHRLRQMREGLSDGGRFDQGLSALHGQGPAQFALPAGLGGEGKGRRQPGGAGRGAQIQHAGGHEV